MRNHFWQLKMVFYFYELICHGVVTSLDGIYSRSVQTEGVKMTRSNLLKFRLEIGVVNLAKFTRDISCLAGDEFLVISEGYHMLIYIFVVFFYCWALYCTTLVGVGYFQS